MTTKTKAVLEKWIEDNRIGAPVNGAVYDPGNEELTCVGIDGEVDLSELASLIESAGRERCAKIAEHFWDAMQFDAHWPIPTPEAGALKIAEAIRKDRSSDPPQAETK